MGDSGLPTPTPEIQPEMVAFWRATLRGVLQLPRCADCRFVIWFPRPYCPECGSLDIEWFDSSGRGSIYSYTINRRGKGYNKSYESSSTYVIAYVELDEGPRILTNIIGDTNGIAIGSRVRVRFERTEGEAAIPRFVLEDGEWA